MMKVDADKIFEGIRQECLFEDLIEQWFYGFGWDEVNNKVTISDDAQILESDTSFDPYDSSFELRKVLTRNGKRVEFTSEQLEQLGKMGFMQFWVNYMDETLPHNEHTNQNKPKEDFYYLLKTSLSHNSP